MTRKVFSVLLVLFLTVTPGCTGNRDGSEMAGSFIRGRLESMGELISAKLTYNGATRYTGGDASSLAPTQYLLLYRAEVRAGFDLSQVEVDVGEAEVTVRLPETVSVKVYVDPDSLAFYEGGSPARDPEDLRSAIHAAEADVMRSGGIDALKTVAREEALLLIKGLLEESVGDRTRIVIR